MATLISSNVVKMSQGELANELGVIQPLVSRLENGPGGTIELLFEIVAYFYQKGYLAYCLFIKVSIWKTLNQFLLQNCLRKIAVNVGEVITELKNFLTAALENIQSIEAMLKQEKK